METLEKDILSDSIIREFIMESNKHCDKYKDTDIDHIHNYMI